MIMLLGLFILCGILFVGFYFYEEPSMKLSSLFSVRANGASMLANLAIVASIIIVSNLLVHLAVPTFSKEPTEHDYCKSEALTFEKFQSEESCRAIGAAWKTDGRYCDTTGFANYYDQETQTSYSVPSSSSCIAAYQSVHRTYERNAFIVLLITFVVMLILGLNLHTYLATSYGLIYGSLVLLISGTIRYWDGIGDYWRLGLLAAALIVLIWLGVRMSQQKEAKQK